MAVHTANLPELTAAQQAALRARLGDDAWRRRREVQRMLEADPESDEAGPINVQRLVRRAEVLRGMLRAAGLAGWGRRNMLAIRRRENRLRLRNLPAPFRSRRILHLTDLHADIDPGIVPAVVRAIGDWEYDAVMFTGDYRAHTRHEWSAASEACRKITAALIPGRPIFAVLGNHDPLEMVPELEAMGWKVLLNEAVPWRIEREELWIAGVDDAHTFGTADVNRVRATVPPGACALLLSHTPATYREAASAGFAGMLAGHTHGGQICLPGGLALLNNARGAPRALVRGPWEYEALAGYTSPGAGACRIPARFFCPPEITRHTLE